MKSHVAVSLALLFGSIAIAAQSANQNQTTVYRVPNTSSSGVACLSGLGNQTTVCRMPITSGGCPVSLRALHGSSGNMLKVDKTRPAGIAQLLHLIVTNPDSQQIVSARVRVRGLSGKGRMTQTANLDAGDATRSMEARFSSGADKEASSDVWVPGMTAVLQVELNSVTFADGSTRKFEGVEACRIAPDPLMLVADR
jgi:hypothetical protein